MHRLARKLSSIFVYNVLRKHGNMPTIAHEDSTVNMDHAGFTYMITPRRLQGDRKLNVVDIKRRWMVRLHDVEVGR